MMDHHSFGLGMDSAGNPASPLISTFWSWMAALLLLWGMPPAVVHGGDADSVAQAVEKISIASLTRRCATLASDAMEGREAGTVGGRAASAYVMSELRKIPNLSPAGVDGAVQEFGSNFRNLLVILPGSDPELRHEIIVIGAHYDHVGRGNQTNSHGPFGYIHNGADDNASGTAALLELAMAFASLKTPPRRTLLFAFWDAEEMGLLGSTHWVKHPTRPLKDLRFVLNIDMLGRLRDGRLIVIGWRSAAGLRSRLTDLNPDNDLDYRFEPKVLPESDFYPFYTARIPVLHLDSGKHEDYHRPTDDADKLNYDGLLRLTELSFHLAYDAAMQPELPVFRPEALTEAPPTWLAPHTPVPQTPRLGVTFDSREFDQGRIVITKVTPGSAAAKAGIRPNDRLLKFAQWEQGTGAELRTVVQIARNPVHVRLQRPNVEDPIDLQVELAGDPVRVGIRWLIDSAMPGNLIITDVVDESPADRAGIRPGDVLLQIGGEGIASEQQFRQRLLTDPGPIKMRIERNGRSSNISVNLFESTPKRQ